MPIAEWQIDVKADRHRCIDRTAAIGRSEPYSHTGDNSNYFSTR